MKKLLLFVAVATLGFVSCKKQEVEFLTITFDTDGGSDVEDLKIEKGDKITKPENPTKESFVFNYWEYENDRFNFDTEIEKSITLKANWEEKELPSYEVVYQNIHKTDFENWIKGETKYVKGKLFYISKGWAWGTEVHLVDEKGNSSEDFYTSSGYGMFTHPLVVTKEDSLFEKKYVFKIVKDTYMSSPQGGFNGTKSSCYNGSKWICDYEYGIDYFDETIKGKATSVGYDSSLGVYIELDINEKIYFSELDSMDIDKIEGFIGKIVYVNCIKDNGNWISKLDHSSEVQVSENMHD